MHFCSSPVDQPKKLWGSKKLRRAYSWSPRIFKSKDDSTEDTAADRKHDVTGKILTKLYCVQDSFSALSRHAVHRLSGSRKNSRTRKHSDSLRETDTELGGAKSNKTSLEIRDANCELNGKCCEANSLKSEGKKKVTLEPHVLGHERCEGVGVAIGKCQHDTPKTFSEDKPRASSSTADARCDNKYNSRSICFSTSNDLPREQTTVVEVLEDRRKSKTWNHLDHRDSTEHEEIPLLPISQHENPENKTFNNKTNDTILRSSNQNTYKKVQYKIEKECECLDDHENDDVFLEVDAVNHLKPSNEETFILKQSPTTMKNALQDLCQLFSDKSNACSPGNEKPFHLQLLRDNQDEANCTKCNEATRILFNTRTFKELHLNQSRQKNSRSPLRDLKHSTVDDYDSFLIEPKMSKDKGSFESVQLDIGGNGYLDRSLGSLHETLNNFC